MREIKFRAWDKRNNCMEKMDNLYWFEEQMVCSVEEAEKDRYIIMQYTGLKDKNGVEIYEGDRIWFDVLQYHLKADDKKQYIYKVVYENASFGVKPVYPEHVNEDDVRYRAFWISEDEEMWDKNYFEVIGNIHEGEE